MDRTQLAELLCDSHLNEMKRIEQENPSIILRATVESFDDHLVSFRVISSSKKLKAVKMIEEKVFIKTKGFEKEGRVVDFSDSNLNVYFKQKWKATGNHEIQLKIDPNYNNQVLLDSAKRFFESEKYIHPLIFSSYSKTQNKGNYYQQDSEILETIQDFPNCKEGTIITGDCNISNYNFYNPNLNESQKQCVIKSLENQPFKILGPPGTGKTQTIVEIILQFLKNQKTVLVCGPSNISIDNVIQRFSDSSCSLEREVNFYRLGSSIKGMVQYNLENLAEAKVKFMKKEENDTQFEKERWERKKAFISDFKKNSPLVFSTLYSSLKESFFFDLCIVDEACQGTELECFMGISKAKNFILVGDPNQLCPSSISLYNILNISCLILNEQYRMPNDLIQFSNNYFYSNQIQSTKTESFQFFDKTRLLFIDTSYFSYDEEAVDQSKMNSNEAFLVKLCFDWLSKMEIANIGVITPYSAQVNHLRTLVNCQVETVDGFQGQEKDIIILSLVRSNDESEIGFLNDKKRLNVAITRCKKGMIVIGDSQNFKKNRFFCDFFKFLEIYGEVLDPETFISLINQ